ncbi:DUF6958 family protein [Chloroflexota bacterium]
MEERVMTLHPQGKAGVNITRERYDTIRESILCSLRDHGDMTFKDLTEDVRRWLGGTFDGSVSWYVTTVKLDLEARGTIERIPKETPQRLRLTLPA